MFFQKLNFEVKNQDGSCFADCSLHSITQLYYDLRVQWFLLVIIFDFEFIRIDLGNIKGNMKFSKLNRCSSNVDNN